MSYSNEELIKMYKIMQTARLFDKKISVESRKGKLVGMYHFGTNQEAIDAGMMPCIGADDYLRPYHRNHGFLQMCNMKKFVAGMIGKETGYNRGVIGDFHIQGIDDLHLLPMDGLVGPDWLYDTGFAFGLKMDGKPGVVVNCQGDGAANMGSLYEALNFASLFELPIVYVVVNNSIAMTTQVERYTKTEDVSSRAAGFNVNGVTIWGQDPIKVRETFETAIEAARHGKPSLIEIKTYRNCGHYFGDPHDYEPEDRKKAYLEKYPDPIELFERFLIDNNVCTKEELKGYAKDVKEEINEAFEWAYAQPDITADKLIGSEYIYSNTEGGKM